MADDPTLQEDYQYELAWGLHHPSFESYKETNQHVRDIKEVLELTAGPDPFDWDDTEIQQAASNVLLRLRKKKELTRVEFAHLCWLERSLMFQVELGINLNSREKTKKSLSRYRHLVSQKQIRLACQHLEDLEKRIDNIEDFDDQSSDAIKESPDLTAKIMQRVRQDQKYIHSPRYKEEVRQKRARLLGYLKTIAR